MKTIGRPVLVLFFLLSVVCCLVYPLLVFGIGQAAFPDQANGSIVLREGQPVGSSLIGQAFTSPRYFWGRPSATVPMPNNGAASGGSNLGPTNPALIDGIRARIDVLRAVDPGKRMAIPVDLVTASASGLDPELSVAAADYQVARIARERQLPAERVQALVDANSKGRLFGFLGEPRVNVLALNLALDNMR
jgi:potassium-transporting ATPase KdpC subunit